MATALAIGLLAGAVSAGTASAGVQVYYIDAQIASAWGDGGPSLYFATAPYPLSSSFGSSTNPAYLSGTWSYNHSIDATSDSPNIGAGLAHGTGSLNLSVDSNGFSAQGAGFGETSLDTNASLDEVDAGGAASVTINFDILDGAGQILTLKGTTQEDGYAAVQVRLMRQGNPTPIFDQTASGLFTDAQPYTLPAGTYQLDLYADSGLVSSDRTSPTYFSHGSSFDLVGSFSAVPEPMAGGVVLCGSLIALTRRKRAHR